MSPNSAALALLAGFAEGKIQMQGETVRHLSGVHTGGTKQVTIKLIQPDGRLINKIKEVSFLDWSGQKELVEDELLEVEIKRNIDSNLCSMGKEKNGRDPDKLSPAAEKRKRAAEAREKKKRNRSLCQNWVWGRSHRLRRWGQACLQDRPRGTDQVPH